MSRNVLSRINGFKLMNLIQTDYTSAKLPDKKFAELAASRLGFPVTEGNVCHARISLEIPAFQQKSSGTSALADRVSKIEKALAALYVQLGWLPPQD
jgi:hypothetical protein